MQRRDLLAMVAGGSVAGAVREAVAATAAGAPGVDVAASKPRTYVLVHGAWHDGCTAPPAKKDRRDGLPFLSRRR